VRAASRDEVAGNLGDPVAGAGALAAHATNGASRGHVSNGLDGNGNGAHDHRFLSASDAGGLAMRLPDGAVDAAKPVLQRAAKRSLDVILSLAALLVSSPVMGMLAAIIRLDSKGPVLYRQIRIGRDGLPFELVKLRTMDDEGRVTRVGRFLRPTGLDELPQFWNVLLGQMSVVGPRPERPHLVAQYESTLPGYTDRHLVRPGITGWAQIHGQRGGVGSIAERLDFDLEYVRSWRIAHDLRILVLTTVAVWRDTRRELEL
jgi:lipopolysaccharide/colanic/teichoic acid biosynthesis glycosyltransferase